MATATPLDRARDAATEELDWAPLDLDQVPPDARAVIEAAQERVRDGSAQIVWEESFRAICGNGVVCP